ncbi:Fic family protein [Endozoicomonas sp. SESOKO1]|uniref:Fic family protein n=1 Tax=Endozoicomonas sp. SESOKO1 TaxID=2828742 RepID=UPI002147C975|nr:Fic family protein [Endozoicomonas sp. SESOKO1]
MTSVTPYLQADKLGEYQDKLVQLYMADAALNQTIPDSIRKSTEWLLRQVNCFYSNKIEGNPTHPKDLLKTQESNQTNSSEELSGAILELLVHLEAQIKAKNASTSLKDVCTQEFIGKLHQSFYEKLPEEHLIVKDLEGREIVRNDGSKLLIVPGEYRTLDVKVGSHIPPGPDELSGYMRWLEQMFNPERIHGTNRVIAAAALHHRLAWIHPFQDGNGRVIRLLTDCYMRCAGFGGYGLWSITRGFGRNTQNYYSALAEADKPRQGNSDGRGNLSDAGLLHFTKYFIDTALDQVSYFSDLLEPRKLGIRIDYYFEMRAKGGLPDSSGEQLPLLKIMARDIYRLLLEKGAMSRSAICQHLGKSEQTLRPILKQMDSERLISAKPKKDIELKVSANSVEFLFPQLW